MARSLHLLAETASDRRAGCGEWMLGGTVKHVDDGTVNHLGNPDRLDCLILRKPQP